MDSIREHTMKSLSLVTGAAFLLSGMAQAVEDLQYTFVEAGYETGEVDVGTEDVDRDAFTAGGSFALTDYLAITASASKGEVDSEEAIGRDMDLNLIQIGFVPHYALGYDLDLVVPVAIIKADARAGSFVDEDDTGYSIGIGFRKLATEQIELSVGFRHVDILDDDTKIFSGSLRFHASDNISFALGADLSEDSASLLLGGRYAF